MKSISPAGDRIYLTSWSDTLDWTLDGFKVEELLGFELIIPQESGARGTE